MQLNVFTSFILFSSSIKLKHVVIHPPPLHDIKRHPSNAEFFVKRRHVGFKRPLGCLKEQGSGAKARQRGIKSDI